MTGVAQIEVDGEGYEGEGGVGRGRQETDDVKATGSVGRPEGARGRERARAERTGIWVSVTSEIP